jgi:hypothetical protein
MNTFALLPIQVLAQTLKVAAYLAAPQTLEVLCLVRQILEQLEAPCLDLLILLQVLNTGFLPVRENREKNMVRKSQGILF